MDTKQQQHNSTVRRTAAAVAAAEDTLRRLRSAGLLHCAAALLTLSACSENGQTATVGTADRALPVVISVDMTSEDETATSLTTGEATRAATGTDDQQSGKTFLGGRDLYFYFPQGVQVVSQDGTVGSHAIYTTKEPGDDHNATALKSPDYQSAVIVSTADVPVYAYFPAQVTERATAFAVAQDQSTADNYRSSDLMVARGTVSHTTGRAANGSVNESRTDCLTFEHRMAKVIVRVKTRTTGTNVLKMSRLEFIAGQRSCNVGMPSGAVSVNTTSPVSPADPIVIDKTERTLTADEQSYCCLVPPQSFSQGTEILRLQTTTTAGIQQPKYISYRTDKAQQLESGHSYTLSITADEVNGTTATIAAWGPGTWDGNMAEKDEDLYQVGQNTFRMVPVDAATGITLPFRPEINTSVVNAEATSSCTLNLSKYYIGETEVTTGLWATVNTPAAPASSTTAQNNVSLAAAKDFVSRLNEQTATQRPQGWVFALPSWAQWVYAFRGGKHSHGFRYAGSDDPTVVAPSDNKNLEVRQKAPNELGLYDMTGNLWEQLDDVQVGADAASLGTDPRTPTGPLDTYRFIMGQCTENYYAYPYSPTSQYYGAAGTGLGLRLAMVEGATFQYTGAPQTFTAPKAGRYKIECWGAQGGDRGTNDGSGVSNGVISGGKGGYATVTVTLTATQKLYVYVGGRGGSVTPGFVTVSNADAATAFANIQPGGKGGWNGGGNGGRGAPHKGSGSVGYNVYNGSGGGGGATHVATAAIGPITASHSVYNSGSGEDGLIVIAGGGGGASAGDGTGGAGGTDNTTSGESAGQKGSPFSSSSVMYTNWYADGNTSRGADGGYEPWDTDYGGSAEGAGGGGGGFRGGNAKTGVFTATSCAIGGAGGSCWANTDSATSYITKSGWRSGDGLCVITYLGGN